MQSEEVTLGSRRYVKANGDWYVYVDGEGPQLTRQLDVGPLLDRIRSMEATPAQRELDDFRKYLELRGQMHTLIANDAYAMTFQTMGQYRTALLRALTEGTPDAA